MLKWQLRDELQGMGLGGCVGFKGVFVAAGRGGRCKVDCVLRQWVSMREG